MTENTSVWIEVPKGTTVEKLNKRILKAARLEGMTKQQFITSVLLSSISRIEERDQKMRQSEKGK